MSVLCTMFPSARLPNVPRHSRNKLIEEANAEAMYHPFHGSMITSDDDLANTVSLRGLEKATGRLRLQVHFLHEVEGRSDRAMLSSREKQQSNTRPSVRSMQTTFPRTSLIRCFSARVGFGPCVVAVFCGLFCQRFPCSGGKVWLFGEIFPCRDENNVGENTVSCATLFTQFVSETWTCSNEDSSWFPVDADAPGEHHRHQRPDCTHVASVFCKCDLP
jgi:hypothetical protein